MPAAAAGRVGERAGVVGLVDGVGVLVEGGEDEGLFGGGVGEQEW